MSLEVVLPRGAIEEAVRVAHSIKENYETDWENILDMFLPHLGLPLNPKVFEPDGGSIAFALLSLSALIEILRWCGTHPRSPVTENTVSRVHNTMDGCLYWCLRVLRVPATPESMPPSESLSQGDLGTKCYLYVVYLLDSFKAFTRMYEDLVHREPALDVAIAFWTGLYDGDLISLYRDCRRNKDPFVDEQEKGISEFLAIAKANPKGLAAAIMAGRVTTPEIFVVRTLQRLVNLTQIHQLPYLSEVVTSPTVEITNIVRVVYIIEMLTDDDADLRALFLEEGAPQVCMETAETMSARFSLMYGRQMVASTRPFGEQGEHMAMSKNALLSSPVASALKMAADSPKSTLSEVEKIFDAGAVELGVGIISTILPWSKGLRGKADEVWEVIERYAYYLELLPVVVREIRKRPLPPQLRPNVQVGRRDLVDVSRRIIGLESFVKHRAGVCDNIRHGERLSNTSATISPKECSGYRSVIYCSGDCQKEDWSDYHRYECAHMSRDAAERRFLDRRYSHHNRAFHGTLLRHAFETYAQRQDLKPTAVPQTFGRDSVVYIDIHRPDNTESYSLDAYTTQALPHLPSYLHPRFNAYISEFQGTNGTYNGRDAGLTKRQNARLVEGRFRYGDEDVNVLLLLKKAGSTIFKGTPTERRKQMEAFEARGPAAKSKFFIRGTLVYYSESRAFPDHREPEPEVVKWWNYDTVDLGKEVSDAFQMGRGNGAWGRAGGLN